MNRDEESTTQVLTASTRLRKYLSRVEEQPDDRQALEAMLELCETLAGAGGAVEMDHPPLDEGGEKSHEATESYADSEPTEVVDEEEDAEAAAKQAPRKTTPEILYEVRVYLKYQLYDRAVDALTRVLDLVDAEEVEPADDESEPDVDDPSGDDASEGDEEYGEESFIDINNEDDDMMQVRTTALIKLLRLAEQTTHPCLFVLYDHFVNRRAAFVATKGRICFGAHLEEEVFIDEAFGEAQPQLHERLAEVPDDDLRAAVALAGEPGFQDAREDALALMARAMCAMADLFEKPIRVDQTRIEETPPTLRFKPYELLLAAARDVDPPTADAATDFYHRFYDEATECALVFNGTSRAPLPTMSKSVKSRSLDEVLVYADASRSIRRARAQMQAKPDTGFVILDDDGFWACVVTRKRTALAWFPVTALGRISKLLTDLCNTEEPGPAPSPDIDRSSRSSGREGRR